MGGWITWSLPVRGSCYSTFHKLEACSWPPFIRSEGLLCTGVSLSRSVSNISCKQGEVSILDTMYTEVQSSSIPIIASLVFCNLPSLEMNMTVVAKQMKSSECSMLAVAIAFDLCSGMDPSAVRYNPRGIRPHLMECLRGCSFSRFPVKKRQPTWKVKSFKDVPLYCMYRMPEIEELEMDPMVKCDACGKCFHRSCMNIPEVFRLDVQWTCNSCNKDTDNWLSLLILVLCSRQYVNTTKRCAYVLFYYCCHSISLFLQCRHTAHAVLLCLVLFVTHWPS